jgi:UDP-N-acetylmuramoyl-tripeptide--D-alanyl-D-alanine ligase
LQATGGRLISREPETPFGAVSIDSRALQKGDLFVAIPGQNHDGHDFLGEAFEKGAFGAVVSEDYAGKNPPPESGRVWITVPETIRALGDLAAFRRRQSKVSVVAITGTNGKTTTKEMTAGILNQGFEVLKTPGNFNNLVGLPLTLFGLKPAHEWAVLEVAMNHPGEIRRLTEIADPDMGVITNVEAGHLEGVRDIDGVMEAKGELLEQMGQDRTAVLNIDDPRVCRLSERFSGRIVTFGIDSSAEVSGTPVSQTRSGSVFDLTWYEASIRVSLKIPGKGSIYDALAAAAVALRTGLSMEDVKRGLEKTVSLPGRMEIVALAAGVHLINDTYNANPGSVSAAIDTLRALKGSGRGILVIGDMLELGLHAKGAHKQIGMLAARAGMDGLYAAGTFAEYVAEGATGAGMNPKKIFVGTREEIAEKLRGGLGPGDWILVKGSRLMAMDKVVDGLKSEFLNANPTG